MCRFKTLSMFLVLLSRSFSGFALVTPSSKLGLQERRIVQPRGVNTVKPLTMSIGSSAVTWVVGSVIGGSLGSPFVAKATDTWYKRISLPDWTPPNRVFPIVWTILYSLIGYSGFRVFKVKGLNSPEMKLAFFHYALNISWAFVFFGMKRLRAGHVMNIALVATLLPIISSFYNVYPLSGILLIPYLLWLLLATALSESICRLNPTVKGYNDAMLEADIAKLQAEAAKKAGL